jgi:hypothetical protein
MCCCRFPTLKNKDGPDLGVRLVLDIQELFRSIVVLNSLFASIAWCLARPNWASMTSTLVLSAIWPFVDTPLKGQLLTRIFRGMPAWLGVDTRKCLSCNG